MDGWVVVSVGAEMPETGAGGTGAERQRAPESPFRAWVSRLHQRPLA